MNIRLPIDAVDDGVWYIDRCEVIACQCPAVRSDDDFDLSLEAITLIIHYRAVVEGTLTYL